MAQQRSATERARRAISRQRRRTQRRWTKARRHLATAAHDPVARRALPGKVAKVSRRWARNLRSAPTRGPVTGRTQPRGNDVAATSKKSLLPPAPPSRIPAVPVPPMPEGPVRRPGLRVGVILDTFSRHALAYEWDQVVLLPDTWPTELRERPIELLFVESAWHGNDDAWRLQMSTATGPREELRELVSWCRAQGIPTVFWNKEDPPNYDRFIETAKLFDWVLTVDADRIPQYRTDLGHERIGLMPFGAQPRVHNPIRPPGTVPGEHDLVFAGTYFAEKHPGRREQMDYLLGAAREFDLHIYSRNRGKDARYRFPSSLTEHVVGSLPYEELLAVAPSYKAFLNVNSVTGSPSMCARRLFELSAAQMPVISAPAASIEPFFGDTISVVSNREEAYAAMRALTQHAELRARVGLRAHRLVFDQHLYTHRVDHLLETIGLPSAADGSLRTTTPSISAIVPTMRPDQLPHVLDFVAAQVHPEVELVLVTHGFQADAEHVHALAAERGLADPVLRDADSALTLGALMNLGVQAASGDYVAKMDDDNYYAPHFLSDLVRAFDYSSAAVVGKWAHYAHLTASRATLLRFPAAEHRYVDLVQGGTILTARETAVRLPFEDLPRRVDTTFLDKVRRDGGRVYSADRFNFVSVRDTTPDGHTWGISDRELLARKGVLAFYGDPTEHATV